MTDSSVLYRVYRRRWLMLPAALFGLLQIALGIDTLFTHLIAPVSRSPVTTMASVMFMILGFILVVVALVNFFATPPIIEARTDGLFFNISAPGQPPVRVPWDALKSVEVGRAAPDKKHKEDPLCLIVRFAGSRVSRPANLSVFHSTKGSFYLRASQLPAIEPIVQRLNALMHQQQKRRPEDDEEE